MGTIFTWKIFRSSRKQAGPSRRLVAALQLPQHNLRSSWKFTFAPYRRLIFFVPARAPEAEASAVLSPLRAELPVSKEPHFAAFQIDEGDRSPRSFWPEERISQPGFAAQEAGALDRLADAPAVAALAAAAVNAAEFAAAA